MPGKVVQLAKVAMINAVVLCVGIGALELVFGDWLQENRLNRLNLIKGRTYTFDVGSLYESPSKTARYTRDQYGLRGNFQKPEQIDILTVGGSTTDQRFITDGETWQDVLQELFEADGKAVVVANAGVDGQSTLGNIRDFDWWFPHIPGLKPRYVLFYVGINDFFLSEGSGQDVLENDRPGRSLKQALREKSAIFHAAQTLYGVYQAEVKQGIGHRSVRFSELPWTSKPRQTSYDGLLAARLREYRERLEVLIAKTKQFGATAVFMTQPSRHYRHRDGRLEGVDQTIDFHGVPINGVDLYLMMRKFDDVMKEVGRRHQVPCIDLAQVNSWTDEDFYDTAHMTPKGARKLGDSIFGNLKELF